MPTRPPKRDAQSGDGSFESRPDGHKARMRAKKKRFKKRRRIQKQAGRIPTGLTIQPKE